MHLRLMNGVCMNAELHEVQGGGSDEMLVVTAGVND